MRIVRVFLPKYWLSFFSAAVYKVSFFFILEYPDEFILLWHLYIFVDIRREERNRAFLFAVWNCLLTSLRFNTYRNVFLFYLFTLWSESCIKMNRIWKIVDDSLKNGCFACDVRTELEFVHQTCMPLFTERTIMAFGAWQLVQTELFSMMDETCWKYWLGTLSCNFWQQKVIYCCDWQDFSLVSSAGRAPDLQAGDCGIRHTFSSLIHFNGDEVLVRRKASSCYNLPGTYKYALLQVNKKGIQIIFILFLHENICCGHSFEAPLLGASNEYLQHQ